MRLSEKRELAYGKLFNDDHQRLLALGMLLENVGIDNAVLPGHPKLRQQAGRSSRRKGCRR